MPYDSGREVEFYPPTWADVYADVATVNHRRVANALIYFGIALGFIGGFLFRYVAFA